MSKIKKSKKNILPINDTPIDYTKYYITNIRRGKGDQAVNTYAKLYNEKDEVIINGDINYIIMTLNKRLPGKLETFNSEEDE